MTLEQARIALATPRFGDLRQIEALRILEAAARWKGPATCPVCKGDGVVPCEPCNGNGQFNSIEELIEATDDWVDADVSLGIRSSSPVPVDQLSLPSSSGA